MKKFIYVLLTFLLVGVLVGCSKNDFKESYESLNGRENASGKVHRTITIDKDHPFKEVKDKDIVKMIDNKETFYVYFGDPLCPWCRSVLEKFIEVAKKHDIKKVYYVKIWDDEGNEVVRDKMKLNDDNTVEYVVEKSDTYAKLLEYFDSLLSEYTLTDKDGNTVNTGERRIYAPNFFYVKDGVPTRMVEGISDKQKDSREELTPEMLLDEENIFEYFFKE